jgi:hypothetical protein
LEVSNTKRLPEEFLQRHFSTKDDVFQFNRFRFRGSATAKRASKRAGEVEARMMTFLNQA